MSPLWTVSRKAEERQIEYVAISVVNLQYVWWAYAHKVTLEFSRLGKPTDNAYIGSFNGSLRDECLNVHWFEDLTDARKKLQDWKREYNESRPHRALKGPSPLVFSRQWKETTAEIL